jgi:hypothetical protein
MSDITIEDLIITAAVVAALVFVAPGAQTNSQIALAVALSVLGAAYLYKTSANRPVPTPSLPLSPPSHSSSMFEQRARDLHSNTYRPEDRTPYDDSALANPGWFYTPMPRNSTALYDS